MTLLIAALVGGGAFAFLWLTQSVVLRLNGEPLAWPLRYTTRKPGVRWTMRVTIQLCWAIILLGVPFALGLDPFEALSLVFPTPPPWRDIAVTAAIVLGVSGSAFAIAIAAGFMRIEPQFDRRTRRGKIFRRCLTPLPLAAVEEGVFRGILLELLLVALPVGLGWQAFAVVVSAAVFSAVHFIKPKAAPLQPALGLFLVGCLFGTAYLVGGRTLWLPVAAHASAIFISEQTRLQTAYRASPSLIGSAEFTYSGLFGIPFVVAMGVLLVLLV